MFDIKAVEVKLSQFCPQAKMQNVVIESNGREKTESGDIANDQYQYHDDPVVSRLEAAQGYLATASERIEERASLCPVY
ncbi:hypothetical protein D3C86_1945190 [compost metagenome]